MRQRRGDREKEREREREKIRRRLSKMLVKKRQRNTCGEHVSECEQWNIPQEGEAAANNTEKERETAKIKRRNKK